MGRDKKKRADKFDGPSGSTDKVGGKKGYEGDYFESVVAADKMVGHTGSVRDPYLEDDEDDLRFMGIRVTNLMRLVRVLLAFPMVIIVSGINPGGRWAFLRNPWVVRVMNMLIFGIPVVLVIFVLGQFDFYELHMGVIAAYIFTYLAPVASNYHHQARTSILFEGTWVGIFVIIPDHYFLMACKTTIASH